MVCDEIRNVSGLGDDRIAALVPDLETGTVTIWDKSHRRSAPCPNCIAGKPRVALYTTCCRADATCRDFSRPGCCWGPDGSGRVLVGEGTIQLAPVVGSLREGYVDPDDPDNQEQRQVLVVLPDRDKAMWMRPSRPDEPFAAVIPFRTTTISRPDGVVPGDPVIIWTQEATDAD
jgi:hypothetical protein